MTSYFTFYLEGELAFKEGEGRVSCPYDVLTNERVVWMAGYEDAMTIARERVL